MKIRPVGAKVFLSDGQTWQSYLLLFAILRTSLKKKPFNFV